MTPSSDDGLKRRLATSTVVERDPAFTVALLDKVKRERRRGLIASFAWTAALAALVGLLVAGFYLGLAQAAQRALGAVFGG